MPGPLLAVLSEAWGRWALWLLDHSDLLDAWAVHVDQVAMALALAAEGIGVLDLDSRWNVPTHIPNYFPADASIPAVIHYHDQVDQIGLLKSTGIANIDNRIEEANAALAEVWRDELPNATFWDWRYRTNAELGSGVGSRGEPLEAKRLLLSHLLTVLNPTSVLDIGCGDGEATRGLAMPSYVGLDLSPEAARRAEQGRPTGEYHVGTLADYPLTADLTLCLDVLIHQADVAAYTDLVQRLMRSAKTALLVSGYEKALSTNSPMVYFHEALSETIRHIDPDSEIYLLREEHEITTFLVLKAPLKRHPRDFGAPLLAQLMNRHPNPTRLLDLRVASWESIGFYPNHAPRLWEYPVVVDLIDQLIQPGAEVIDVGAGVNPLVPYLSSLGYIVHSLDPSHRETGLASNAHWNEWEFLDYADAGLAHRSWNCTLDQLPSDLKFDAVCSVSVIEHLSGSTRRALLREIADRLNPKGIVILTVDLVRGGDQLWNRRSRC